MVSPPLRHPRNRRAGEVKAEAIFNHRGEPTVTVFPETQQEIDILLTMRGKASGSDGNHRLVMGMFVNEGSLESSTFTTNPVGHASTFIQPLEP